MENPRILVVEDEPKLARILEGYLREAGFQSERAENGRVALERFSAYQPHLVLLDLRLPELDGLEVLKTIRTKSTTPVVVLTARVEELDTVLGLELGADDYIAKPFRPREVVARVRAVLRRSVAVLVEQQTFIQLGSLQLDASKLQAVIAGKPLDLTTVEFRILFALARAPERIFSRAELLGEANPDSEALERTVDSHITNLRRKLEKGGLEDVVHNVRGVGYRLKDLA
jgi:two-component system, OmpR family, response regulator AdeR